MPGTLSIVSQGSSARAGSWVGSCPTVVNAPTLQGIQFPDREVGEPGSGTMTGGCDSKSWDLALYEMQSSSLVPR